MGARGHEGADVLTLRAGEDPGETFKTVVYGIRCFGSHMRTKCTEALGYDSLVTDLHATLTLEP